MNRQLNEMILSESEEELLRLQKRYPFSNYIEFSMLKFYGNSTSEKAQVQIGKTLLHFQNSRMLEWQLAKKDSKNKEKTIENKTDIEEIVQAPAEVIRYEPAVSENEPMIFEPLHTTDYFASQGIKLTDEPISTDKLGKQMKSFTEWLKSMKKINSDNAAPSVADDKKIQQIAESSNSIEDVATEALARVYTDQGKPEKAMEIYEKLSLINPAKRAYFAAKIESLK